MPCNPRVRRAARRSGYSVGYVSRVLTGRRNPRLSVARSIAHAMEMSMDHFCRLVDERTAKGVDPEVSAAISNGLRARKRVIALAKEINDGA